MNENAVKPLTILLVEDELADTRLVSEALRELRIEAKVTVVNDGYAALDYLRQQAPYERVAKPDLVVLDLNLPGLRGETVLRLIRKDRVLQDIPVVVLTTASTESIAEECRKYADDFIVKAMIWPEFVKRLGLVVSNLRKPDSDRWYKKL
jgi:chemotaxis family two-component system response regulator Rcp1